MTVDSPIIAEVRRVRHQIAEECGTDLRKITEHAIKAAKEFLAQKPRITADLAFSV